MEQRAAERRLFCGRRLVRARGGRRLRRVGVRFAYPNGHDPQPPETMKVPEAMTVAIWSAPACRRSGYGQGSQSGGKPPHSKSARALATAPARPQPVRHSRQPIDCVTSRTSSYGRSQTLRHRSQTPISQSATHTSRQRCVSRLVWSVKSLGRTAWKHRARARSYEFCAEFCVVVGARLRASFGSCFGSVAGRAEARGASPLPQFGLVWRFADRPLPIPCPRAKLNTADPLVNAAGL